MRVEKEQKPKDMKFFYLFCSFYCNCIRINHASHDQHFMEIFIVEFSVLLPLLLDEKSIFVIRHLEYIPYATSQSKIDGITVQL